MIKKYPNIFKPLRIKNTVFKNRLFSAPNMMCQLTPDGRPTDYMIAYYETKAKGGAAQVTVGDTPVDEEHAPSIPIHPVVAEKHLTVFSELARAIKSHGAVASLELNHGGKTSLPWYNPIGPVTFTRDDGVQVKGMDKAMMNRVADNFAKTASLVKKAGFDMCMIHGAHGWLLDQFLSPLFNSRDDKYGGSLENRAKFPIMVIDRVREAVGSDFLIEYRLSGSECIEGGLELEEATQFAKMIEDKIDLLHVSAALDTTSEQAVITQPTIFLPHGVNVKYGEAIKKEVSVPIVTVGSISDPDMAESILSKGRADVVAMARSLIADPDFPRKARSGMEKEIIPCLRCLDCLTGMHTRQHFACSANPRTGREFRMANTIRPASVKKRVLIAGGGPGGMMAAITAAERGHDVILAEKTDRLGGLLKFTDHDDLKLDLRRYKDYLINRIESMNIKVEFNIPVSQEYVSRINPDSLILAVGSDPVRPDIPGIDSPSVMHASGIYHNLDGVGNRVAIIGGGLVGCETAVSLAETGRKVTVIEMGDRVAPEANWMHFEGMMASVKKNNIDLRTNLRCVEITGKGVSAVDTEGLNHFFNSDTVLYAVGMKSNSETVEELRDLAVDFEAVGDCVRPRRLADAIHEAYFAAVDLA